MDDKIVSKQFKKRDIFANCITFIKSITKIEMVFFFQRNMLNQHQNVIFNNSDIYR